MAERRAPGAAEIRSILAEQSGDAVVIGIGLDVSAARDELPAAGAASLPATSLLFEGSASLDRGLLLSRILAGAERWYLAWRGTDPPGKSKPPVCAPRTCASV